MDRIIEQVRIIGGIIRSRGLTINTLQQETNVNRNAIHIRTII